MLANSSAFALFAAGSDFVVRTYASALAFLAARLVAVVYAKVTRRRALAAVVLDFVVRTNVRTLAFHVLYVSAKARCIAESVTAPAYSPPLAVMTEHAATTFTTLSIQFVVSTPRNPLAHFARPTLSSMLAQSCTFAVFAEVLFAAVAAKSGRGCKKRCRHKGDTST